MKVLVCGGRHFNDWFVLSKALDALHSRRRITVIVHGGASGADSLADYWAEKNGIQVRQYKADWKAWGRAAGPRRNTHMLEVEKPDVVVAFPGGRGTADMVKKATAAGVKVWNISVSLV